MAVYGRFTLIAACFIMVVSLELYTMALTGWIGYFSGSVLPGFAIGLITGSVIRMAHVGRSAFVLVLLGFVVVRVLLVSYFHASGCVEVTLGGVESECSFLAQLRGHIEMHYGTLVFLIASLAGYAIVNERCVPVWRVKK